MVTQLTKNAIDLLTSSANSDEQYVIQVLQSPKSVAENLYKTAISDGFAIQKNVYFVSEAAQNCENLKELSIIKCKKYVDEQDTNEKKKRVIICNYELIYPNVNEMIGKPIDYKLYKQSGFVNAEGSSVIPQKYLSRNAQVHQQNQATQPKHITPSNQTNNNHNNSNNINSNNNSNNNNYNNNSHNQNNSNMNMNKNAQPPVVNNNVQKPVNHQSMNRVNQNPQQQNRPAQQQNNQKQMTNMQQSNENDEKNLDRIRGMYPGNSVTFKARITKKGELKKLKSEKAPGGECILFSIDVIDCDGSETTITFFGEQATKFHSDLNLGFVFIFRNGTVKENPNKLYNKGEYVLTITKESSIIQANDDGQIQKMNLNIKTISQVQEMNKDEPLDLICIVKEDSECKDTVIKSGSTKARRDIIIFDSSLTETTVTLWGETAQQINAQKDDIMLIKDAKIGEFNNRKQININFGTQIFINPDPEIFPQVIGFQNWYLNEGIQNVSNIQKITYSYDGNGTGGFEQCLSILVDEIEEKKQNITMDIKIWKEIRASVIFVKDQPLYYNSCHKCKKKAIPDNEVWRCNNCNTEFNEPESRYIASLIIGDSTNILWVSAYDDVGKIIFGGRDANDFRRADNDHTNGQELKKQYIQQAQNKEYRFLLLTKAEVNTSNSTLILKTVIQSVKDDKPAAEAKKIYNSLEQFLSYADQQ